MKPPSMPSFAMTTRLSARALGVDVDTLAGGFRHAVEADLPRVLSFRAALAGVAPTPLDEGYLRWRYRLGRPPGTACALGELWLLELGGQVLALIGGEDVVLCTGAGERLPAVRPMDLQIVRSAGETGLGVWMNQALAQRAGVLLAIGGNRNSRGIVERLFVRLPSLRTHTCVIDSRPFLHKSGLNGAAADAMALVGNGVLRLREQWSWLATGARRGLDVRPIARFDEADRLDDSVPQDGADGDALGFERQAARLNHRLFDNPRASYYAAACHLDGRRAGAIAWRLQPGLEGLPEVQVVDAWAAPAMRARSLAALAAEVVAAARRSRCHAVRWATADPQVASALGHLGFASPRDAGEGMPMGLLTADPERARALARLRCTITAVLDDDDGTYGDAAAARAVSPPRARA